MVGDGDVSVLDEELVNLRLELLCGGGLFCCGCCASRISDDLCCICGFLLCGFCNRFCLRRIGGGCIRHASGLVLRGEEYVNVCLAVLVQVDVGEGTIYDDGVDEVFVVDEVCLVDSDGDVFCAHLASADFGEVNLVERDLALDIGGEDAVDVTADGDLSREVTRKILVVDGIVQVRLDAGECKSIQVQEDVEVVGGHVGIDLHVQVTAVCKLEAHVDAGRVVFEINGRDIDGKVLEVELGADFCILVDDIALVKYDVSQAELDGEPGGDFGSALAAVRFNLLFFGVLGVIDAVLLGEEV